jgi:hypothetical protein
MRQHLGRSINGPWVSGTGVLGRSTASSRVDAVAPPSTERPARTWTLVALAVLGVALVVMPAAFGMFARAPKGAVMLGEFRPFMTTTRLDGFQRDIQQINAGVQQSRHSVASYLGAVSTDSAGSGGSFKADYPSFASFSGQWGAIDSHMTSLLDSVQGNLGNYQAVAALPSFRLFPWFFVVPGALVLLLVATMVLRPRRRSTIRWVLVALGLGLVLAPAVFQMFQRAPKGGQMMSAFKTIETTSNVETIQGYFGEMAVGQGAIRLELVPALERTGLSQSEINTRFPAVATLDDRWVHILNDMTPMIGAMSDNVVNYQAIAALPPFPLFPYFFVLPGLLIAGVALAAPGRRRQHQVSSEPPGRVGSDGSKN